jgi:ferredoxin
LKIHFISPDGETTQTVEAKAGDTLLDVAQNAGQPLEGTCEGQMACSTCHVIIDKAWFDKLPLAHESRQRRAAHEQAFLPDRTQRGTRRFGRAYPVGKQEYAGRLA